MEIFRNRTVTVDSLPPSPSAILATTQNINAGWKYYDTRNRPLYARRTSNDKSKGWNNRKCGNKYLGWAFVEAANFAKRYDERCRKWFDRKAARTNKVLATKALACKLAKAAWHVMAHHVDYDAERVFGRTGGSQVKGLEQAIRN